MKLTSHQGFSVGLIDLCSTNSTTGVATEELRRIYRATSDSPASSIPPSARRKWTRLTDEQRCAIVLRYEAGETSTVLAAEHGVAKSTILGILRANNAVVRRQSMTPEQVSKARQLYESGLSLSQTAAELNVNQETMRVAILRAGTTLRPPTTARSVGQVDEEDSTVSLDS